LSLTDSFFSMRSFSGCVPKGAIALSTSVGRLAEHCVEGWLESEGWACFERNMRVPGGEIDRLFVRERGSSGLRVDLCVAEVKATRLRRRTDIVNLFSSAKMRSLIRPAQLRILWRSAAFYERRLQAITRSPVRTYVRYFLVVYGKQNQLRELRSQVGSAEHGFPVRLCRVSPEYLILAWSPEHAVQAF
jgi:Holliday junction resolvase-like predicted endonuclease